MMNTAIMPSRPASFWFIAVLALLWNLLGVAIFLMQMTMSPEMLAAMPPEQQRVQEATPSWLNIVFAVAVFSGALGATGLLLKKRWAVPLFGLSLIAVLVQLAAAYLLTPVWEASGVAGLFLPAALILIAALLLGYSRKAAARGWLG